MHKLTATKPHTRERAQAARTSAAYPQRRRHGVRSDGGTVRHLEGLVATRAFRRVVMEIGAGDRVTSCPQKSESGHRRAVRRRTATSPRKATPLLYSVCPAAIAPSDASVVPEPYARMCNAARSANSCSVNRRLRKGHLHARSPPPE